MKNTPAHAHGAFSDTRVRSFKSPGGREWTVAVFQVPPEQAVHTSKGALARSSLLRFTAADITLDLVDFPADWHDLPDSGLTALLRLATLPAFTISLRAPDDRPIRA